MFNIRFVAYSSDGTRLGAIPTPLSFQMRMPLMETPTLQITWTDKIPAYDRLDDLPVLAAEWSDGGEWTEFLDGRFYPVKHTWDRLDDTGAHSCDYKGLIGALDETLVWDGANTEEGRRKFENKTPTQIFTPIFNAAVARGSAHFLLTLRNQITGTQTACTREYELGNTLFSVLQDLTSAGEFEYRVDGTALVLANRVGSDLTLNQYNPTWIRDILSTSSPEEHDYSQICNVARLVSDNNNVWTQENQASISLYGRREKMISQAGVTDAATARQILTAYLNTYADFQPSYSREYPVDGTNRPLPGRDFNPGDATYVDTKAGHKVRLRISEISYKQDSAGTLTAYVTFGALTQSTLAKLAKTQSAITGGASISPIGVGTPPYTPGIPAAPLGLRAECRSGFDIEGNPVSHADLSWQPVGVTVDGREVTVTKYRVGWRESNSADPWNIVYDITDTSVTIANLPAGRYVRFCVAAITKWGVVGEYAVTGDIELPVDFETTPPTPSLPIVDSKVGSLIVKWDGLDANNRPMPMFFRYIRVWVNNSDSGRLTNDVRTWTSTDLQVGQTYEIRFQAVGSNGAASQKTPPVSIEIKSAVQEADIQQALQDINQQFADTDLAIQTKGKVFYNASTNPPTATSLNDIWFTTGGQILKPTAVGSTVWEAITLADLALQGISAGKISGQITETQIADNSITTGKIAANAITADSGIIANAAINNAMIASLDAGKITTGTLDAQRIGAHTITAEKLVLSGGNLFPDPNLTDHTAWRDINHNQTWPVVFRGNTSQLCRYEPNNDQTPLTLEPGSYRLGAFIDATVTAGSNFKLAVVISAKAGGQVYGTSGEILAIQESGQNWIYTTFEIPETISGNVYSGEATIGFFTDRTGVSGDSATVLRISLQRAGDGNLIVDGAITTNKLAANAISADKIQTGAIETTHIAANAITADKLSATALNFKTAEGMTLNASTITGTSITGATITGGTLQTATTGSRYSIDVSGLKSYDNENKLVLWLNSYGVNFYYGDRHLGRFNQGYMEGDTNVRGIGLNMVDSDYMSFSYNDNQGVARVQMALSPKGAFTGAPGIRFYDQIVCGPGKNNGEWSQCLRIGLYTNPNNGWNYAGIFNSTGKSGFAFGATALYLVSNGVWKTA